ncbi:hypothetical protein AVMA1855_18995 [Acidovorax sp. SUPP1855]|uniref:hypothetical protein n=1 Tax=Acidovorax sp. SUPP1855 TaxID=431774 RepID=UPI0023DE5727|nr:hypothetical protein [Acidovorax sp. SUPP1855]GKS86273.1 hypothetical protein AVMA1855_18995 [Acidovorax sp. SUPP1855]
MESTVLAAEAPWPQGAENEGGLFDFFRDADAAGDSALLWRIAREQAVTQALSGLFHGPAALVQLRLWAFLQLARQGEATLARERIDEIFHALRPEALDTVLKRFRDVGLLAWDDSARTYALPPLAQRVAGLLAPLASDGGGDEDGGELAALLGQVVGANQLGALDAGQVQLLQAQLTRLHGEFADAIASGSEFRLRAARQRYDRAAVLIDRASEAITAIIGHAHGHIALERAARGLGQAQSRLLAMASQFNRALQQVDRQRVTLGTTGITSTDVKRWLQTVRSPHALLDGALGVPAGLSALAPHELLDVTEAEFERDRPVAGPAEELPGAQPAPAGNLTAVALPSELGDLSALLQAWSIEGDGEAAPHGVAAALLGATPADARYAQVAYKAQLLPLLGDPQAGVLPGATGALARLPWRVQWEAATEAIDHPQVELLSQGRMVPATAVPADAPAKAATAPDPSPNPGPETL